MKIVNLTPHTINLANANGTFDAIEPSGKVARVKATTVNAPSDAYTDAVVTAGYNVTTTSYGEVEDLPEPQADTVYVVSSLVAQRCAGRLDVFIPNESVRDEQGRIIGCKSLGRV